LKENMSNKMLVSIIIVIILIGAAGAGYYYWQQTKPLKITPQDLPADQSSMPTPEPQPQDQASASTTPVVQNGDCVRDFSQSKLTANSGINIQNRQVQISVKGFGNIVLQFYPSDAPKAVQNFLRLADSGYYDCLTFHRVAKGFVIQGGDPNGDGSGGQSAFGAAFADELNPDTASYKAGYVKGVLAMANSGPNTNGSQFFIMLADNDLPHLYTIFGKVSSGLDVVDKIGAVDITPQMSPTDGKPKTPVVMTSVKIIK